MSWANNVQFFIYKINTFSGILCLKRAVLVFSNFSTTKLFGRRLCNGITDGESDRRTDGWTDVQRLTIVYDIYTILLVLVMVVVLVVLAVVVVAAVLVVMVVQLFMNYVLTQPSSGGSKRNTNYIETAITNQNKRKARKKKTAVNSTKRYSQLQGK